MASISLFETSDKVLPSYLLLLRLVDFAKLQGLSPECLLKGSNLNYRDLIDPTLRTSFDQLELIIANLYKYLPHNEVSFQLGQHFFGNGNTIFETALLNAKNLAQVLRVVSRFGFNAFPFYHVQQFRSETQHQFVINCTLKQSTTQHELFFYELLLSIISMFIAWRFPDVSLKVELPFARPAHIEQYQSYLKFECEFDKPLFLISLTHGDVRLKQVASSPLLRKGALKQLQACQQYQSLLAKLSQAVIQNPSITLEAAAGFMHISPATLKRKLKQHNTNFKHEKDLALKYYTLFHLTQKDASNSTLSSQLAINDLTNFRRMFKRWTGKTPNQLRLAR